MSKADVIEEEFDIEIPQEKAEEDCFCRRCGRGNQGCNRLNIIVKKSLRRGCCKSPSFICKGTCKLRQKRRNNMTETKIKELEKRIGYEFHDMKMLMTAMCHSSYANEHRQRQIHDNERLEFLGDAVLEVSSSDFLFHQYPQICRRES